MTTTEDHAVTEVADRVYRVAHAYVSCYLVEEGGRLLLVDAGLPRTWATLGRALRTIGRVPDDLVGIALTHAHFDHLGVATRLQDRLGIPVWVHVADHHIAAHPYRYAHESPRLRYPLRYLGGARILASMARAGALAVPGVRGVTAYPSQGLLDLPGRPVVLPTPGHTDGHVALHLPDRDVLLTGDALVTLDPYTGREGPQIVAGAATADSQQALASLDLVAATRASVLLPGHGEPWRDGAESAVALARAAGPH